MLSFIQHDKVSNNDTTFHIKTGFRSKLHRDDRQGQSLGCNRAHYDSLSERGGPVYLQATYRVTRL